MQDTIKIDEALTASEEIGFAAETLADVMGANKSLAFYEMEEKDFSAMFTQIKKIKEQNMEAKRLIEAQFIKYRLWLRGEG